MAKTRGAESRISSYFSVGRRQWIDRSLASPRPTYKQVRGREL